MSRLFTDHSELVGDESNNKQGKMSQSKYRGDFAGVWKYLISALCVYTVYNNAYVFGDLWSN